MLNKKYLINKLSTNKFYDIKETTEILSQYGISKTDYKTRDLIAKGRLKARPRGTDPNDRRSGFEVSEKSIYDLIITEIPIMKDILDELNKSVPKNKSTRKTSSKTTEQKVDKVSQ